MSSAALAFRQRFIAQMPMAPARTKSPWSEPCQILSKLPIQGSCSKMNIDTLKALDHESGNILTHLLCTSGTRFVIATWATV